MSKDDLHRYLRVGRDVMVWKLDGLSEYDVRRPLVPTGTNLLGLVKHLAGCEIIYFATTFGRPFPDPPAWHAEMDRDTVVDMYARPDESREEILGLYRAVSAHADATIEALGLDAVGRVPHWDGDRAEATLHRILVHMATETHRHAGHADILRETIDGAAGFRAESSNLSDALPDVYARVDEAARPFRGR